MLANMSEDAVKEFEAVTGKKVGQQFGVSDEEFEIHSKRMRQLAKEQASGGSGPTSTGTGASSKTS